MAQQRDIKSLFQHLATHNWELWPSTLLQLDRMEHHFWMWPWVFLRKLLCWCIDWVNKVHFQHGVGATMHQVGTAQSKQAEEKRFPLCLFWDRHALPLSLCQNCGLLALNYEVWTCVSRSSWLLPQTHSNKWLPWSVLFRHRMSQTTRIPELLPCRKPVVGRLPWRSIP